MCVDPWSRRCSRPGSAARSGGCSASSWVSNIGDGLAVAAGPLLVASETRDPFLVALAAMLAVPPLPRSSACSPVCVADRVDRRRMIVVSPTCAAWWCSPCWSARSSPGEVNIAVVLAAMFLLGVGETFADTTTSTLLPMIVAKRDLGIANARVITGIVTLNQLAGPPIGALLFGLGRACPFVTQCVCVALSVLLVLRVRLPAHGVTDAEPRSIRSRHRRGPALGVATTPPSARSC